MKNSSILAHYMTCVLYFSPVQAPSLRLGLRSAFGCDTRCTAKDCCPARKSQSYIAIESEYSCVTTRKLQRLQLLLFNSEMLRFREHSKLSPDVSRPKLPLSPSLIVSRASNFLHFLLLHAHPYLYYVTWSLSELEACHIFQDGFSSESSEWFEQGSRRIGSLV